MKVSKGLIRGFKQSAKKIHRKKDELKAKVLATSESAKVKLDTVKDTTVEQADRIKEVAGEQLDRLEEVQEKLEPAKKVAEGQASSWKEEMTDLKRIFQSKNLVFFKTNAFAVVLRKLGGLDEFLDVCDKLTKEGYRLVFSETNKPPVDIPIPGLKIPLGTFYYFQHRKYITK
jgi:hypothetical protein